VGDSLARAKLLAYSGVREIRWPGAWCRKDISDKATAFELASSARAAVASADGQGVAE
jgi:phosphoribosylamine--glycine ligase